jgi:hypothetical protein
MINLSTLETPTEQTSGKSKTTFPLDHIKEILKNFK